MKTSAILLAASTAFLNSATLVFASGCIVPPCGEVSNETPWGLKSAAFGEGVDLCDVWNTNGGETRAVSKGLRCQKSYVGPGQTKGGFENDRTDVDGFCFEDRDYVVEWQFGESRSVKKGEYTKISSYHTATCENKMEKPVCTIRIG